MIMDDLLQILLLLKVPSYKVSVGSFNKSFRFILIEAVNTESRKKIHCKK